MPEYPWNEKNNTFTRLTSLYNRFNETSSKKKSKNKKKLETKTKSKKKQTNK